MRVRVPPSGPKGISAGEVICPGDWIVEESGSVRTYTDDEFRKLFVEVEEGLNTSERWEADDSGMYVLACDRDGRGGGRGA